MGDINALLNIDFSSVLIGLFVGLFAIKSAISIIEWFCSKLGIETKWNRQKREEIELLQKTANAVKEIEKIHKKDKEEVNRKNDDLENALTIFMEEMREVISETQATIQQYGENRINDREVSIQKEKQLNDRIDSMNKSDKIRDAAISEIGENVNKLTSMFVEKQITDFRWEIINFASNVAAKKPCTKDAYTHCFKTYERYEKVLEENNLENGEVEISMEVINESYKQKLLEGF